MNWYLDNRLIEEFHEIISRLESKKQKLDLSRPFSYIVLNRIKSDIALEWTYHSNSIEGNTLNLNETKIVLEEGMTIKGKTLREHFEIVNHHEAIDFVSSLVAQKGILSEKDILELHSILMTKIEKEFGGRYRNGRVRIMGANFVPPNPLKVNNLMTELINNVRIAKDEWPVVWLATLFHHHFVHIHPFFDGNGRMVRLVMNLLLMKAGYPSAIILQQDRKKYYDALNKANNGDYEKLFLLILQAIERSLNIYLNALPPETEDDDYGLISQIVSEPGVPYGQEYVSLLARKGHIDAYKEGRNWYTRKSALLQHWQKNQKDSVSL